MQEAAQVISFRRDAVTTHFLDEMTGTDAQKLNNVCERLGALESLIYAVRNSEVLPGEVSDIIFCIELMVKDTLVIASVDPIRGAA